MHQNYSQILTRISKSILSKSDTVALLQSIYKEVLSVFEVESTGLLIINEKENYYYDLTAIYPEMDNGRLNQQLNIDIDTFKMEYRGTALANHIKELRKKQQPVLFNIENGFKKYPPPFRKNILTQGYKEAYAALLQTGEDAFAVVHFFSKRTGAVKTIDALLFQQVTDLISTSLSNILTKENLLKEKQFKETLLAISESVASTQNRKQLFTTIFQKIAPIIPMDDTGIIILNEDGTSWKYLSNTDHYHESPASKKLQQRGFDGYMEMDDYILTSLTETGIVTIDEMLEGKQVFAPTRYDAGLKEFMYTPLVCQGKTIGSLFFYSSKYSTYSSKYFKLFKAIAEMIAVAVSNVIANEKILEREKEKTILLEITELIAQVKNRDELLTLIVAKIKPIFNFHDCGLFIISKDGNTHTDLAAILPDVSVSDWNEHIHSVSFNMPHKNSPIEWAMNTIIKKGKAVLLDFKDLVKKFPTYPQFNGTGILEIGYRDCLAFNLMVRGEIIGMFCINALAKDYFRPDVFSIFQSVSESVSIAVANILANEEILEREKEKTVLLNISNAVAKINSKVDLLKSIDALLLPVFQHDDASFCIVDKEKKYFTDYYNLYSKQKTNSTEVANEKTVNYKQIYKTNDSMLLFAGSFVEHAMKKPAMSGKLEDIIPLSRHAAFIRSDIEAGLTYYICAPLSVGGNAIGLFMLDFKEQHKPQEKDLQLFIRVADILALAFANLLANEEIIEREKEKSILLSISQQISQIRDLDTMVNWLHMEANRMHQSQHVMIVLTSPKENTVQLILGDADAAWQQAAGMRPKKGLVPLRTPYKDSIFEHIESLPEGELYSAADFNFPETPDFCSKEFQLAESFYVRLIHKGDPIGHISFHTCKRGIFKNIDISLCKNFANQLSVSLINILSNEAILRREKQKIFEIKINNAVLKNDRFDNVLKEVTESIHKAVGCDICYIRIRSDEIDVKPFNLFCEKKGIEYLIRSRDGVLKEMAVKHADIEQNINHFLSTLEQPLILTGSEFEKRQNRFSYLKAFKSTFHIQSFAFIPLHVKGNAKVQLIIGSKRAFAYIDNDLETINQVIPQLSLTLDNRLAFVQIQKLKEMLETENLYLQEEINDNYNFNEIVGSSEALRTVFSQASMVAGTDTTVLIGGETGTGKELIARAIHNLSGRKDKIMVKVNCACLPAQLIESELFGHEKGAFTGAIDKRIGKFELANGGTIFLDEIGELPLELQSKLLRVIQEREFERIGGRTILKTDIRIIAATNKNLEIESKEKRFRSDLYYRLNVFPIVIPALRERKEDIPLLTLYFAKKFGQRMRKSITAISSEALQEMMLYDWPGNIRELEHVIEHSVISSKSSKLVLGRPLLANKVTAIKSINDFKLKTLNENEREHIVAVLKYCNGRVRGNSGAARLLDIHPNTLESRMVKLGIKKEHVIA